MVNYEPSLLQNVVSNVDDNQVIVGKEQNHFEVDDHREDVQMVVHSEDVEKVYYANDYDLYMDEPFVAENPNI